MLRRVEAYQGERLTRAGQRFREFFEELGGAFVERETVPAHQRARGERAFYHFKSDHQLAELASACRSALPVHLPKAREDRDIPSVVAGLVEEIEAQQRGVDVEGLSQARAEHLAIEELGLSLEGTWGEAQRARLDASRRDERALLRRFERWFPAPRPPSAPDVPEALERLEDAEREDLELVLTLLSSVTDVVELLSGEPLQRHVDAIEIFERLLCDSGVPPWRYAELFQRHPAAFRPALDAVHHVVAGGAADPPSVNTSDRRT
jgi:hypothetical protein